MHGLYHIPAAANEIIVADHDILKFTAFFTEDFKTVCGIRAWFFGIEFDLLLDNLPPGVRTSFDGAVYRPSGLGSKEATSEIELSWESGPGSEEIMLRASGHGATSWDTAVGRSGPRIGPSRAPRLRGSGSPFGPGRFRSDQTAVIISPLRSSSARRSCAASAALRPAMTRAGVNLPVSLNLLQPRRQASAFREQQGTVRPHIFGLDHDSLALGQRELVAGLQAAECLLGKFLFQFLDQARGSRSTRHEPLESLHRQGDRPERGLVADRHGVNERPQGILGRAVGDFLSGPGSRECGAGTRPRWARGSGRRRLGEVERGEESFGLRGQRPIGSRHHGHRVVITTAEVMLRPAGHGALAAGCRGNVAELFSRKPITLELALAAGLAPFSK